MAANPNPIYTKNGDIQSVLVTAANTSSQGGGTIGTDIFLAGTVDATNGGFVQKVRWMATATAATNTTATVGRVFLSTQASGSTTSANTYLIAEVVLPQVAADNSSTATFCIDVPIGFALPAGMSVLVTNHASPAANTAWRATMIAGDY